MGRGVLIDFAIRGLKVYAHTFGVHCLSLVTPLLMSAPAFAQCGSWDNRFGIEVGASSAVLATTTWDPDGEGPLVAQLVAAGVFNSVGGIPAGKIARWDGSTWRLFGSGLSGGEATSLTTWDPDGSGPLTEQLVAGGAFATAGGVTVNNIARWDGTAWRTIAGGTGSSGPISQVYALTTWDPDGSGPQAAQLVAGGKFSTIGGKTVNRIARWDGVEWHPFGTGMSGGSSASIRAVTTWDPDGAGPLAAQLIAGGVFNTASGVTVSNVARWDGLAWQTLGGGVDAQVASLTTWDPDGSGPQTPLLVAGGTFVTAGGLTVNRVACWNGSTWQSFGSGVSVCTTTGCSPVVSALETWDPDGDGPQEAHLVATGIFVNAGGVTVRYIARWDGAAWHDLGGGMIRGSARVSALAVWDADGDGPQAAQLVVGGSFTDAGGILVKNIASWDGSAWEPFGNGISDESFPRVSALMTWDPDGSGPQPSQLVAGGKYETAGNSVVYSIARWDGSKWHPFDNGLGSDVYALAVWDPDGSGPLLNQLVAGGSFKPPGGTIDRIARWDGSSWQPLGIGIGSAGIPYVRAITTWDPDGGGPQEEQIVAGGPFIVAGGVFANGVARWDGSAWHSLGTGVSGPSPEVRALATWDPDGSGPLAAQLFAGGSFTAAGGASMSNIARWDGTTWHPLGTGMNSGVVALLVCDPDGVGPLSVQLVAGGGFTTAGGVAAKGVARWDGTEWHAVGTGTGGASAVVYALTTVDPDGAGPLNAQLVIGGGITRAGSTELNRIARWDGSSWHSLGDEANEEVIALTTWDPDGSGSHSAQLVAGGDFTMVGDIPAGRVAMRSTLSPVVIDQPEGTSLEAGQILTLSSSVESGVSGVNVQWQRNGVPIIDGPGGASPDGGVVIGASASLPSPTTRDLITLYIEDARVSDSGEYTAVFTNPCGSTVSTPAIVTVVSACPSDYNSDSLSDILDFLDFIDDFSACELQPAPCGTLGDPDFNGDTLVDILDFLDFIDAFSTGC